jgi:hypothetical protein
MLVNMAFWLLGWHLQRKVGPHLTVVGTSSLYSPQHMVCSQAQTLCATFRGADQASPRCTLFQLVLTSPSAPVPLLLTILRQ